MNYPGNNMGYGQPMANGYGGGTFQNPYAQQQKFSSTFSAIEGMWSYPSSNPGIAGDINPYAQQQKFSSTFSAIEGMWSYPSSNPGIAGDINPYAQIDQNGNFDKSRMPWYADIQPVDNYK